MISTIPRTPAAVQGAAARTLAQAQGRVSVGIANQGEIAEEVGARALIDREGDAVRSRIWGLIAHAKAEAKAIGATAVYAALVTALGHAARYEELDAAEDGHDAPIAAYAAATADELREASVICTVLLGGRVP